ncbi:S-layer homology domain-containing protein [Brevibacillus ruminantium]|uniref:S-layer homology domain-containing protein n=1 Tax=Brevibacillus ruminantium TaxID=2950604 RepID=A0ABY4WPC6_9BACL|nr:S-layer homology domain-containing protein [Brevibacillus ruminantium]USG67249.1 S-layer homology domain-containing protein [Brevibacillus ruminantium]
MKKMLILASLAAIMAIGSPIAEAETTRETTPFADVTGHWAEKDIQKLYIAEVIGGSEEFRPDEQITRAELLTLFVKAKKLQAGTPGSSPFADVHSDDWLSPYAQTAYRLGIIDGEWSEGKLYLHPDKPVQREEMVSMLIRAMGDSGKVNQFPWTSTMQTLQSYPDGGSVEKAYQRPFAFALQNRIVNPYQDGKLQPDHRITRAEAATYVAMHLLKQDDAQHAATGLTFSKKLTVQTTAFTYPEDKAEALSYLELPLRVGIVAVDPEVIPLGSHLYIEGYGYAVAADIGSAVKQDRVDLFFGSRVEALQHGIKDGVTVYILN